MDKDQIEAAKPHEIRQYLNKLEIRDHRFDKHTHYHSSRLRVMAKKAPLHIVEHDPLDPKAEPKTYEFFTNIADQLDDYHGKQHEHGHGRIVVLTDEEVRTMALSLAAGTHGVYQGQVLSKTEIPDAKHNAKDGTNNGSSSAQPEVRKEDGNPAGGG